MRVHDIFSYPKDSKIPSKCAGIGDKTVIGVICFETDFSFFTTLGLDKINTVYFKHTKIISTMIFEPMGLMNIVCVKINCAYYYSFAYYFFYFILISTIMMMYCQANARKSRNIPGLTFFKVIQTSPDPKTMDQSSSQQVPLLPLDYWGLRKQQRTTESFLCAIKRYFWHTGQIW